MMDQFMEEVVTKRKQGVQTMLLALANVLMVVCAILGVMYMNVFITNLFSGGFGMPTILSGVLFLLMAGIAVFLFLRRDRLRTEYEYTFTNGVLDFAQVYNNKHRKALGTMNLKNIEACGMVASENGDGPTESFKRYINSPGIKRTNWFLNREADLLYLYFVKESQKRIIIIEPSEEMRNYIRRALVPGVWQKN